MILNLPSKSSPYYFQYLFRVFSDIIPKGRPHICSQKGEWLKLILFAAIPLLLSQSCWVESDAYNQIFRDGHVTLCLLHMLTSTIWSAYWTFVIVSRHAYCHMFDKHINR